MEIRSVGVLGAGQMGLGIAQACARAGLTTVMAKATPGSLDAQKGKVEKQLLKDVEKGKLTQPDYDALVGRITWSTKVDDLAQVDLLIESIVEELPIKREHFARLDGVIKKDAIFATNTSTLTVAEIAAATKRPESFVGLHFFNPVHAMKLVEVAPALKTSAATVEACLAFAKKLGKVPVVVADRTGYIVNRLLVPYIVDGIRCLESGLGSVSDIDTAMMNGANHPMGPLALADFIGLDIVFHMASLLQDEYKEARFAPPPLLRRMVLAGYLGRKSGTGFYVYAENPPKPHTALLGR